MKARSQPCPLCGSILTREKYLQIVGVWDDRKKLEAGLKNEIKKLNDERLQLKEDRQAMRREKALAVKAAAANATAKERRRADKMSLSIQAKALKIQSLTRTVRELQEQLKKGTTPQVEGLNYERALVKDLEALFRGDIVKHTGKGGDILLCVHHKGREIGCILFECKLTGTFHRSYIVQTKKAIGQRNARYGVLVTLTGKKGTAGLWTDSDVSDIFMVHPFGACHLAGLLRQHILEQYLVRVSKPEADRRSAALMDYIKGDEFRNLIGDTIFRTQELYGMLLKERKSHHKMWNKEFDHYRHIYANSQGIRHRTGAILNGTTKVELLKSEPKLLPAPPSLA